MGFLSRLKGPKYSTVYLDFDFGFAYEVGDVIRINNYWCVVIAVDGPVLTIRRYTLFYRIMSRLFR